MSFESQSLPYSTTIYECGRLTRPHQWYKQSIVFLALIFSGNLLTPAAVIDTALAAVAFTCICGSVYTFNDILDVEEDRNHPQKKHRPIASGAISIPSAVALMGLLVTTGVAIGASLNQWFLLVLAAYVFQNILYSTYFKQVVIVDIIVIAIGFVLRAAAGSAALEIGMSPWLITCTFLTALFLALGKRYEELETTTNPSSSRKSLDTYTSSYLQTSMVIVLSTLLMSYSLYTFYGPSEALLVTLPFAFFAIFRYYLFIDAPNYTAKPTVALQDTAFRINLLLWGLSVITILYWNHITAVLTLTKTIGL